MIRRFDRRIKRKNIEIFMNRRIDQRFDDSIVDSYKIKILNFTNRRFEDSISIRRLKDKLPIGPFTRDWIII